MARVAPQRDPFQHNLMMRQMPEINYLVKLWFMSTIKMLGLTVVFIIQMVELYNIKLNLREAILLLFDISRDLLLAEDENIVSAEAQLMKMRRVETVMLFLFVFNFLPTAALVMFRAVLGPRRKLFLASCESITLLALVVLIFIRHEILQELRVTIPRGLRRIATPEFSEYFEIDFNCGLIENAAFKYCSHVLIDDQIRLDDTIILMVASLTCASVYTTSGHFSIYYCANSRPRPVITIYGRAFLRLD
ncbi:unnamed protein product [Caenorhabditis bovis]|uniref:Uncharacterized protein n=1 Tax=Caenorhabditis bovis TaxID=2654633 RepID=A0A8S1EXU4_9PELO|nr:unnamed protein product [Caenorhabditis bovis]